MAQSKEGREVILGVDTHLDAHVGVVIDGVGKVLGTLIAPAGLHGYQQLLQWSRSFGACTRAGVEGTGTYGAGLARVLRDAGIEVLEVNRADRSKRRLRGKSDPTDAENAARAVLSGEATAIPKLQSGVVEAMRAITVARRSAVKAKTQAINQLRALLVTAPDPIRSKLMKSKPEDCVQACIQMRALGTTPLLEALTPHVAHPGEALDGPGGRAARAGCDARGPCQARRPPDARSVRRRSIHRRHAHGRRRG